MGKDNRIAVRMTDKEKQTIQAKAKKSPHLYELLQSELDVKR